MRFFLRLLVTGLLAGMASAGSWAQLTDARALAPLQIEYPPVSKRLAEDGRVLLSFMVRANGQVDNVEVVASSGYRRLDEAAKAAVSGQRFVPASKDGVPIETKMQMPVNFKLSPSGQYMRNVALAVALLVPQGDKHPGNPKAMVRLRLAPDGKILDSKLERSSSDGDWDTAVLRTLGRMGPLPADEDGNVPDTLFLEIRPIRFTPPPQGPSVGYVARVFAAVKPNIILEEDVAGNPLAEVEVRLAADGNILATKLVRSSGVQAWDQAVLRSLQKTRSLPTDAENRVPPVMTLGFRPKD